MTRKIDFSRYSSIKVGTTVAVEVIDEPIALPKGAEIIGGANNLLVSPTPPPLFMLSKQFAYIEQKDGLLYIGAATKSGVMDSYFKREDIGGFEYLFKLPGTLGGLIKMNAGMKDDEITDYLVAIKTHRGYIQKNELNYGYRYMELDDIVYEAIFEIKKGYDKQKLEKYTAMRSNQPKEPSAGSLFKNPKGDYAGRLIESVGLKGYRKGGMAWSDIHSNFLVNMGNGNFDDAIFLVEEAKRRVMQEFGIELENEVLVL